MKFVLFRRDQQCLFLLFFRLWWQNKTKIVPRGGAKEHFYSRSASPHVNFLCIINLLPRPVVQF